MNNKVLFPPKNRQIYMRVLLVAILIIVVLNVCLFILIRVSDTNLDGNVVHLRGTCIKYTENDLYVNVDGEERTFKTGPVEQILEKKGIVKEGETDKYLSSLAGKEISFDIPKTPFDKSIIWMLSLTVDGENVAPLAEVLENSEKENKIEQIVLAAISGVCAVVGCVMLILRVNTPPLKECDLTDKFAEFFADRQPLAPTKKFIVPLAIVYGFVLVATVAMGILSDCVPIPDIVNSIVLIVLTVALAFGVVVPALLYLTKIRKENVKFFDEKFPFDFGDVNNLPMIRKNDRADVQKELDRIKQESADIYPDGGNMYNVRFTENGVDMYEMYDEEENGFDETSVENVFASEDEQNAQKSAAFSLPYSRLNFVALPYYGLKNRPITVVVRSRLTADIEYPETFTNDIHFLLDKDLVDTIRRFDVQVEGLSEILSNTHELMVQNYLHRQKKQNG